jgi:hypothetical protein
MKRTEPEDGEKQEHLARRQGAVDLTDELVVPCDLCGELTAVIIAYTLAAMSIDIYF